MEYKFDYLPNIEDIKELYSECGWITYLDDENKLLKAMKSSPVLLTIWEDNKLIGIVRALTDFSYILFIQDILIMPKSQHMGIGTDVMKIIIEKYSYIRQIVLIADDESNLNNFYEKNGFINVNKYGINAYAKINS